MTVLEKSFQEDPWSYQASQWSLNEEFQANKTPCLRRESRQGWRNNIIADLWFLHVCTCTYACTCTHLYMLASYKYKSHLSLISINYGGIIYKYAAHLSKIQGLWRKKKAPSFPTRMCKPCPEGEQPSSVLLEATCPASLS